MLERGGCDGARYYSLHNTLAVMNARRVHELMRRNFPALDLGAHDWVNVADSSGLDHHRFESILNHWIAADEVLIEVHRKLGVLLSKSEASAFAGEHLGEGHMKIADRDFKSFVVLATNGVATGWRRTANNSLQRTPSAPAEL